MDKNIYRLLNEIEMDVDQYDEEEMNESEIKNIEKNMKQHMRAGAIWKKAATTAAVLCLGMGMLFNKQGYAFAESISHKISSIWQLHNVDKYVDVVNTSQQDQGYIVTLNEVIMDNDELIISQTIHNGRGLEKEVWTQGELKVNGEKISDMTSSDEVIPVDDYTQISIDCVNISDIQLNSYGSYEIEYNIFGLDNGHDVINGNWTFHFTVTGEELRKDTVELILDDKINLPNGDVVVLEKYSSNPVTQKIYYRMLYNSEYNDEYFIILRGCDDAGVPVKFSRFDYDYGQGVFKVADWAFEWEYEGEYPLFEHSIRESAKQLILTPYLVKFPENIPPNTEFMLSEADEERLDYEIIINIK